MSDEGKLLTFAPIALSCDHNISRLKPFLPIVLNLLDNNDDVDGDGSNLSSVPSLRQNCNQLTLTGHF